MKFWCHKIKNILMTLNWDIKVKIHWKIRMTNSEVGENTVNFQNGTNEIMKQNSAIDKCQKG